MARFTKTEVIEAKEFIMQILLQKGVMTWSVVLQCEVLVREAGSVDGHAASSRVVDHVSSETQKPWHDTVEHGALIRQVWP